LFLGSNRNKPKLNLFQLSFGLLFRETKNFFFGLYRFVSMFRTGIETTGTNRTYGMGKGGQTAILVCWSAAQRTTEMLADQRTGKNSGPAPADYPN
jgi:hypothetical protein